ncbi:MAG TPA: RluA family pseudouridine synthase [Candidatus Paceibacterota bacterium]|nr:RluA family pseudouridine synthase [Verrucomicrobiota bacterium]HRY48007.1 RluA family pseudouridine synthase [Candidatus Paceibacterota bacterium]HRZ99303.1 RluA family pseudouridine synthase [Candidatus Paceibacterota bacterium]
MGEFTPIKISSPETREFWEIPVLFEDEHLMALDKPSRLLTSPEREEPQRPSLMALLHRDIQRGAPWASHRQLTYLANAHRPDFDMSGILLLAKSKTTLMALANLFSAHKVDLKCLALVWGVPGWEQAECDAKLAPHPHRPGVMRADIRAGKKALSTFRVLERFRYHALVECHQTTHRPHQIRVHLKTLGFPLAGDSVYGGKPLLLSRMKPGYRFKADTPEKPLMGRAAVHAAGLRLVHPASSKDLEVISPVPKDFTVALRYLRQYSSFEKS